MKKQSSHYPKEFKQQAVELVNTGRPVPQVISLPTSPNQQKLLDTSSLI